ncbi:LytTR family transcriptional regulator DNA-binding domain-containing protein [Aciduricibacillus chroicocephali]|uniref:LytTR family transcriptional regulator DNA-binding domain-containing protein n=1 Tax=Aciduricibacillus chroicocephali TaxID=3054939 RepID=A0ABY9KW63_9BACI|nr:LytTR family transcriptional regulator DNA-binding domain-containing protein [Bacillaceae bacterium 44XB]
MEFNTIENIDKDSQLPAFSLQLNKGETVAIYSNAEMQEQLLKFIKGKRSTAVFEDWDALYERLTVAQNIKFYRKWFKCEWTFEELLVRFQLHHCANRRIVKCTASEKRRVSFAKCWMAKEQLNIFTEPVHGMDVVTTNVLMEMLSWIVEEERSAIVLVANMEHAVLLCEKIHHLKNSGLHEVEMEEPVEEEIEALSEASATTDLEKTSSANPYIAGLYKIPAKTGDKVILFDPTEIDYIESQDGRVQLVLNDEYFMMDLTLVEAEKKLSMYGFYRCHRSYIVNLQKVREIITWSKNTYSLRLHNRPQSTIPLSRTKVQEIQQIFNLK